VDQHEAQRGEQARMMTGGVQLGEGVPHRLDQQPGVRSLGQPGQGPGGQCGGYQLPSRVLLGTPIGCGSGLIT
jgi:hypothetical protein